jgi:glycosyltransferase involved in cell wall biosynthesis
MTTSQPTLAEPSVACLQVTVCICTYNGAGRIRDVIEALSVQSLPRDLWEVLVIDNASTDDSGKVASQLIEAILEGHGRVVHEARPGLSFARQRAAVEARGEIVCFLDDDNVPEVEFVSNALKAFANRLTLGAVGGRVIPVWEKPPTALALAVQDFALAICDRGNKAFAYGAKLGPVGAGLCIRRELLRKIYLECGAAEAVTGRKGQDCGGGEDLVIAVMAWHHGFERWYDPSLVIRHILPEARMHKDYLLRLYSATGQGQAAVRRLFDWKARTPLALVIAAKDSLRWLRRNFLKIKELSSPGAQALSKDLNDLEMRLLLARSRRALAFWR